jgi:tRNA threonylcarbamoyladenosine biosynthesis protein TsaE
MFETHSAEETLGAGRSFAAGLRPGDVVALSGSLGSGKTQFVKGVCVALGAQGNVSSPTFTIVNEYPAPFGTVVHVDLYRIRSRTEVAELGLEEYFTDRSVTLIEWPEIVADILPAEHVEVRFEYGAGEQDRMIGIGGGGA